MSVFDKLIKSGGGYIFLSHSHEDIEKVREIRNMLEREGFEPLCFYLKCLSDDSEIEELIKREIDAREWFVFVDSENSRKSKWVTLEREYISRTNSKKIVTINIDDETSVSAGVDKIKHSLRVFLSYSPKDSALAKPVIRKLHEKDYLVYEPGAVPYMDGMSMLDDVTTNIRLAAEEGCVVALLTADSVKDKWLRNELMYAHHKEARLLTVIVGDVKIPKALELCIYGSPHFSLSENPTESELEALTEALGQYVLEK